MKTYQDILFNETLLKEFSPVPLNYSCDELKNFIKLSETIWLLPIIGEDWYQELLDQVANNTLTDENATALVEAIYPYEGYCVVYEALPSIYLHVSEVGLTKGSSDSSESATQKEVSYYSDSLRRQVEARKDYLIKWLCERQDSFPLFDGKCICDCGCGCSSDSCCGGTKGKLNKPNPLMGVYSTLPKCDNIK